MFATPMQVTELLSLALKKLAIDYRDRGFERVWLSQDPEVLHPRFAEITKKYVDHFPSLRALSFTHEGAFSYSRELTDVMGTLQLTGAISRINPTFDRFSPVVYDDAKDVVTEEIARLFGNDQEKKAKFEGFVGDLASLVVEPQGPAK